MKTGAVRRLSFIILTAIILFYAGPLSADSCEEQFIRTAVEPHSPTDILNDPDILRAVEIVLVHDYKWLTDLIPRDLTPAQLAEVNRMSKRIERRRGEKAALSFRISRRFSSQSELLPAPKHLSEPRWTLPAGSSHKATFDYIEATWGKLARITPPTTRSSLIPLPHPVMIPGARFQEAYYWDSYFAVHALVGTGRSALVRGQIENFLFMIDNYGLVPNGNRDYYRSRSQPPVLATMVSDYLRLVDGPRLSETNQKWLAEKVLPTVIKDYRQFWMNPATRFDSATRLNNHFDALNVPRPERHAADDDAKLGRTYRDVRAEAESGKDFTAAFEGEATKVAPVLLNSVLYRAEREIAALLRRAGKPAEAQEFELAAERRKTAMNELMRDPKSGLYFDYHLRDRRRVSVLTADTFTPLWAGVVTGPDAILTARSAMAKLEHKGGIVSSDYHSGKQWDAPYVWAPHMMFAVEGLRMNGLSADAVRIARGWIDTVDAVHGRIGVVLEKYDAVRGEAPIETGDKYVTQQGFLWSNGVYVWILRDVLKERIVPLPNSPGPG